MATALSSLANTNTSSSTKPKSGISSSLPVEEVNQNLASESPAQRIVSAVGQIADAVQGISREVQSSTCMVAETVERTQESEKSVRTLIDSTQSIGQVVGLIESVAAKINMLALNATIEAARAGDSGKGFAVVAGEVKNLANQTAQATQTIKNKIASVQSTTQEVIDSLHGLSEAVSRVNENCTTIAASTEEQTAMLSDMTSQAAAVSAQFYKRDTMRLVEMAQTLVQLIVRNLYERTADCRWWATDDAFCSCLQSLRNPNDIGSKHRNPNQSSQTSSNWISRLLLRKPALETQTDHSQVQSSLFAHASDRLAIINRFYSVYLNLVLLGPDGRVLALSKKDQYPHLLGADLSQLNWFKKAMKTQSGDQYVVDDIYRDPLHGQRSVAVYAAAVREQGKLDGRILGVLGVYFDWKEQARVIVKEEPNLSAEEWQKSRVLLLDANLRIIADSSEKGELTTFALAHGGLTKGAYRLADGSTVTFAKTIGYQEYDGLGWWGVIIQQP